MTAYKGASSTMPTAAKAKAKPSSSFRHVGETSGSIAYHGSWHSARHGGYAGGAVRYATKAGATATITFTGKRIAWYGPVGPDARQGPRSSSTASPSGRSTCTARASRATRRCSRGRGRARAPTP